MLSNNALKLLKWFAKEDGWRTVPEAKQKCKHYDDRAFKALKTDKYLEDGINLGSDQWAKYRISDAGKAYLEGSRYTRMANIREWLSFFLSVAAIVISIIALLMQEGIP